MHLLVVKKNHKDGSYNLLYGISHLEYLKKHTGKIYVPCIIDEQSEKGLKGWLSRIRANHYHKYAVPWSSNSWSIFRTFLKQEPRFNRLSPSQKLKVIFLAIRYKKTTISSMRKKVDKLAKE
ncbi:hypothetical protein [Radiobacillus sp. PE A8.2]|uniref:hypothetical protein n=1 Tax=Radiobacillus sp. PE A8.2 TaxID=3380349 RepID=UPI00388E98B0